MTHTFLAASKFLLSRRPKAGPTTNPDRVIGWASGTPPVAHLCIVLMVHDQASELFVPVYFVLCSSKTKDTYFDILELVYRDTSEKFAPCDAVSDFELPLINPIEKQFPTQKSYK
ncbi:hypothetical protein GQ600_22280 [Phytophthora cactorum]|nr:hypothetical protein GQ600_22280 [Phytophthora cactorum]